MPEYNLVIEINEAELLADYAKVGSKSTDIPLLIESSLTLNCFPGLERIVEINKVNPPKYIDLLREISEQYLTCEIPNDFFVLSEEEQYRFLEENAWERYEFDSGEYLFREINKETHGKFLRLAETSLKPESPTKLDLPCECETCAEEGDFFECPGCLRSTIPYCQGGSDEYSDYCTPCWYEITYNLSTVVIQKEQPHISIDH